AIWLISVNTLCSMNSIRPSNICALLAKCRYRAASLTSSRAARAAVVMRSAPGCSSMVASACRICTRRSPGFGRLRTTAGAAASAPGVGSGESSSAWDIGSTGQRFKSFSHTQPWLFPNPATRNPAREPSRYLPRQGQCDFQATTTGAGSELEVAAVHSGDLLGDREAQAVALALRALHAVEALQDARLLRRRHAGPVVLHLQEGLAAAPAAADRDAAALVAVLDGVVHQVGQQLAQQPVVGHDLHRLGVEAQVDAARRGGIELVFQRVLAQGLQV